MNKIGLRLRVRPVRAPSVSPVLVGGGTSFFAAMDGWVNLNLVETGTFPDGLLLSTYETGG